jgi:hypothetical protein
MAKRKLTLKLFTGVAVLVLGSSAAGAPTPQSGTFSAQAVNPGKARCTVMKDEDCPNYRWAGGTKGCPCSTSGSCSFSI